MKSPAFQFYPNDWLSSRRVRIMTAEQRGWYIQLLCEAWESEVQGTLPYDMDILWILAGAPNQQTFNASSTPVIAMFELKDDTLIHHRLIKELVKQKEWREKCSNAGKASAEKRKEAIKEAHLNQKTTKSNASSTNVQLRGQPKVNQKSTLQSSVFSLQTIFSEPTSQEVESYAKSIDFQIDGERFLAYYRKTGWKTNGGAKIVDWRSCVVTWKKGSDKKQPSQKAPPSGSDILTQYQK